MRYLIDPEFRVKPAAKPKLRPAGLGPALRRELSVRNLQWARQGKYVHEVSLGAVPAVLYREDEAGVHGNFLDASYRAITATAAWNSRLSKVHTSARRALLSRDPHRRELDSSNSSDALLMNIFCHPATLRSTEICALLAIEANTQATFGYKPRIALIDGKRDSTEIDLKLGDLLVEAKLTESDFTTAPMHLLERYRDFESTLHRDMLEVAGDRGVGSYQIIRGVLAAALSDQSRFCVLCDARRTDLIEAWHRVMMAVKPYHLRCRLQLLTWQELAVFLPHKLRQFLDEKYGI